MTDRQASWPGPAGPPQPRGAGPEAQPRPEPDEPEEARAGDEDLTAAVDGLRAEVARLDDAWRRALADLDNLRKRTARDTAQREVAERARAAAAWLPVLDNLDLAAEHAGEGDKSVAEGIRAVRDQAVRVMADLGFPRRDDVGAKFDPARHEAVATEADPAVPAGTVVRVLRPGYGDDQHLLRPAAVIVAAPAAEPG
jgi:molecular chaperone GrpE